MRISLDTNDYDSLLSMLSMIKDMCMDIDIHDGIIRQRSDNSYVMYEADLSDLIGKMTLPLLETKPKIDLMKMFLGSEEVIIEANEEQYSFKDDTLKISMIIPISQFVNNKFSSSDEAKQIFDFDNSQHLLSYTFSQKLCERMKIITNNFNIETFSIEFDGETASIKASPESKNQSALIVKDIDLDINISDKYANLTSLLFIPEHDGDLEYNMFINNGILTSKVSTSIKGINYNIYSRTRLMDFE